MVLYTKEIDLSFNLLYPLLGFKKYPSHKIKPSGVYCYWDIYTIEERYLIVRFNEMNILCENEILKNPYLVGCFDNFIYVFNLLDYTDDVESFLQGKYSELSESTKKKIFAYHSIIDNKKAGENRAIYQILRPELYYNIISSELNVPLQIIPIELYKKPNKKEETLEKNANEK